MSAIADDLAAEHTAERQAGVAASAEKEYRRIFWNTKVTAGAALSGQALYRRRTSMR